MIDLVLVFVFLSAIFMGISIGSSSVPPAFGPVTSSGIIGIFKSALMAGVAACFGAILQGGSVTSTVGSGLIFGEMKAFQAFIILFIASILVIISVTTKYPMPTAFTVVGAVIGSSMSFGKSLQWVTIQKIIGYWLLIPILALGLGYLTARFIRHFLPKGSTEKKVKYLTLIMGLLVAYNAGANSVGLAVGPLNGLNLPLVLLLVLGGISILIGAWIFSPMIIHAVSFEYSSIGPRRSASALGTAAFLAQVGIFFGIPISFNEAIIASIIGSGLVVEGGIGKEKLTYTSIAWVFAFSLAIIGSFALSELMKYLII